MVAGRTTPELHSLYAYIFRDDATGNEDILAAGVYGRAWAPLVWRSKEAAVAGEAVAKHVLQCSPPGTCRLAMFGSRLDLKEVTP